MKKFALLLSAAILLSFVSTGCSSSGNGGGVSSWCRTGSLFPAAQSSGTPQVVYQTAGMFSQCDPCEPAACNPCEPVACNPCEPVCDPCVRPGIMTRGPLPGPGTTPF